MGMSDGIRQRFENSDLLKKVNEKSTFGVFLAILTGLVAVVGVAGKVLDEDKSIALWLSHLGGHLKSGHLWSLQNRPLWMAET
jgi:hypothetical protein